jgi:cell division protein FtsZ
MMGKGLALMGTGSSSGPSRAIECAEMAVSSPLLEDVSIDGATGILVNITGGVDISLNEVNDAMSLIEESSHEDANIIFGTVIDEELRDEMKITVIATGFDQSRQPGAESPSRLERSRRSSGGRRGSNTYADSAERPAANPPSARQQQHSEPSRRQHQPAEQQPAARRDDEAAAHRASSQGGSEREGEFSRDSSETHEHPALDPSQARRASLIRSDSKSSSPSRNSGGGGLSSDEEEKLEVPTFLRQPKRRHDK